jgi:acyl carrier protein
VFTTEIMPRLLNRFTPKPETPAEEGATAAEAPPASEPAARAKGAAPAKGELEELISESWRRVLGHRTIDVNDNFFELGGDSLMALQAVSLLKARLGREVPIVAFYEAPTVARLAKVLGTEARAEQPVVELGEVGRRADTRLEMMQRRRRARAGAPVEAGEPR